MRLWFSVTLLASAAMVPLIATSGLYAQTIRPLCERVLDCAALNADTNVNKVRGFPCWHVGSYSQCMLTCQKGGIFEPKCSARCMNEFCKKR